MEIEFTMHAIHGCVVLFVIRFNLGNQFYGDNGVNLNKNVCILLLVCTAKFAIHYNYKVAFTHACMRQHPYITFSTSKIYEERIHGIWLLI